MAPNRKIAAICAAAAAIFSLTSCTAPQDPFVSVVKETVSKTVFEDTGRMASGCIGVYLFCLQPLYEPAFFAPDTVPAEQVCDDLFSIAKKLGVVAYGVGGYGAFELPNTDKEVIDFCETAVGQSLKNADGSDLYQGINFFDDGAKDGFGKLYNLSRGASEFGDGYTLVISFSKDPNRVGSESYATGKPKLLVQEDLDEANESNSIAAETMKVANPLLGQSESIAKSTIEEAGLSWVVIDRDNEIQNYDQTYDPSRIMLTIREGKIYDAIAG